MKFLGIFFTLFFLVACTFDSKVASPGFDEIIFLHKQFEGQKNIFVKTELQNFIKTKLKAYNFDAIEQEFGNDKTNIIAKSFYETENRIAFVVKYFDTTDGFYSKPSKAYSGVVFLLELAKFISNNKINNLGIDLIFVDEKGFEEIAGYTENEECIFVSNVGLKNLSFDFLKSSYKYGAKTYKSFYDSLNEKQKEYFSNKVNDENYISDELEILGKNSSETIYLIGKSDFDDIPENCSKKDFDNFLSVIKNYIKQKR